VYKDPYPAQMVERGFRVVSIIRLPLCNGPYFIRRESKRLSLLLLTLELLSQRVYATVALPLGSLRSRDFHGFVLMVAPRELVLALSLGLCLRRTFVRFRGRYRAYQPIKQPAVVTLTAS
jgi:hypothetical protein